MKLAIPCLYSEYGRHIDSERAIPYFVDLLKPVERRVLKALNDISTTKLVKSARVVGDVIGKYHPHGDASAYGVLVNCVEKGWANKKGNFGLYGKDYSEPAAYRYCVSKDSLISTEKGIKPIIQLKSINKQPLKVSNVDNITTAIKWFKTSFDTVYKLCTKNNYELKCNDKHPLVTLDKYLDPKWSELKNIKPNQYIILKSYYNDKLDKKNKNHKQIFEKLKKINLKGINYLKYLIEQTLTFNIKYQRKFLNKIFTSDFKLKLKEEYYDKEILHSIHTMLLMSFGIKSNIKNNTIVIDDIYYQYLFLKRIKNQTELKQFNINSYLKKEFPIYTYKQRLKIKNLIEKDYIIDKVDYIIRLTQKDELYCLRVNSEDHSFVTNGFISHNTEVAKNSNFDEYCFNLAKYVPWTDPDNLGYEQPLFLTTPIPIGLIASVNKVGNSTIKGIAFNTCEIPKYTYNDLINRLTYLFKKQNDPNLEETTNDIIIPYFYNHDVYEAEPGAFKNILEKGEGSLLLYPKMTIDNDGVHLFGYPPNGTKKWISFCEENEIDIIDLSGTKDSKDKKDKKKKNENNHNSHFELILSPKKGKVDQEFVNLVYENTFSKINIRCNVVNQNNFVELKSIDDILLSSYNIWIHYLKESFEDKKNILNKKIFEYNVIEIIRDILNKYNVNLKKIEDVLNIFNTQNEYISKRQIISNDNIVEVCKRHNIKSLFDYKINKDELIQEVKEIDDKINNIAVVGYNLAVSYSF